MKSKNYSFCLQPSRHTEALFAKTCLSTAASIKQHKTTTQEKKQTKKYKKRKESKKQSKIKNNPGNHLSKYRQRKKKEREIWELKPVT